MGGAGATPFAPLFRAVWTVVPPCAMSAGMEQDRDTAKPPKPVRSPAETSREDRLKAALKANMARRKAQAKARAADNDTKDE